MANPEQLSTRCAIVGGGPAGMMLGMLLARAGVETIVLEKHADFLRDFRGDTIHPSTLEIMHELGLLNDLLKLPHQEVDHLSVQVGDTEIPFADLTHLPTHCRFVAFMPQWDFLNFLSKKAAAYPEFDLRMEHEVTGLSRADGRVQGVTVRTRQGIRTIEADLTVACDGRHSIVRTESGLPLREIGAPVDVLWFRLSRRSTDPAQSVVGNINYGKALILLDRGDYFQAGLIIKKGSFAQIQQEGLEALRSTIAKIAPSVDDRVSEITGWNQVKLLSVQINRLRRWYQAGLLCIGDAAHAMSPAFGVGINLAIQDAVAAANILGLALSRGESVDPLLRQVQRRREFPTQATQFLQTLAHRGLEYVFRQSGPMRPPLPLRIAVRIPGFQHAMARVVGIGVRPERVDARILSRRVPLARRIAAVCAGIAAGVTVAWRRSFAQ